MTPASGNVQAEYPDALYPDCQRGNVLSVSSGQEKIPTEKMVKISNQLLCARVNGFVECNAPI